ncbi:MAG TPA: regulatory protein RecX [Ktedonobacterales bacterium]|nr:regulatory protein RecX [Ktedonobacterales bacterium]
MPSITAVRPDERRPDHYHIEFDTGGELLLDEALVAEERLAPGDRLDEADIERLRAAAAERDVFDRAARFLAARPRSRAEVRRRLLRPSPRRAPPPADAVERALDRLERLGYLDDAAFAAYWAEQRERFSPRSARAVRQELRQRGVDAETAAASADPDDDEARAVAAGRKRLASLAQADYQTFYTRMGGFLQRRGFGYGVARVAIRRLWAESHGEGFANDELGDETGDETLDLEGDE